jgi:hypothetical protein
MTDEFSVGELETAGVIETPAATHLRYRVG